MTQYVNKYLVLCSRILAKKLTVLRLVKDFHNLLENEGSLPRPQQQPTTCPYAKPV